MKFHILGALTAQILVAAVCYSAPVAKGLIDLGVPSGPKEMFSTESGMERFWKPVSTWQEKANRALQGADPVEDLKVVQKGLNLHVPDHDPVREFLDRLGDKRLLAALAAKVDQESLPTSLAAARARIAKAGLDRSSMASSRAMLELSEARFRMVSSPSFREGMAAFTKDSRNRGIAATSDALQGPRTVEHYSQLYALLEEAELYSSREVLHGVAHVITESVRGGLEPISLRSQRGNPMALKATARGALLINDPTLSRNVLEEAETSLPKDDPALIEVRYWSGVSFMAAGNEKKAIEVFARNAELPSKDQFVADSVYRLGRAYLLELDHMNAAINFMDAAESFPDAKRTKLRAEKALQSVLDSRQLKRADVRQAYISRTENNRTALNKGGNQ